MKGEQFRLPTGAVCDNADQWIAAWRDAAKPIEGFTGLDLYAFDPDFAFQDKWGLIKLDLPAWLVLALAPHLPGECGCPEILERLAKREKREQEDKTIKEQWESYRLPSKQHRERWLAAVEEQNERNELEMCAQSGSLRRLPAAGL